MSIKEGYLRKWSANKNQWNNVYCKLLPSGWFQWFENASSISPKRSIDIPKVTAFLAFGDVLNRVPCKPTCITAAEIPQAFGVPHEPHAGTKMSFFVCANPMEMSDWMNAITSLIQNRPYQPPAPQPVQPPPPYMPSPGVPGQIGFMGMPQPYDSAPPPPFGGYGSGQYGAPPVATAPQPVYGPGTSAYPQQPPPPAGQAGYYRPPAAGQQFVSSNGQPYEVVYVEGKPKKKKLGGLKNAAVGLASGLAGGYLASRMFGGWGLGGGWGGGFGGLGRWGSWSSFSSFSWSD